MLIALIVLAAFAWYAVGISGFIYWWTQDFDFTSSEVPLAILVGVVGLIAWPMGYCIHGRGRTIKAARH